ncbi:hypothetical protein D3876_08055 [Sphingomonas cavernae]|uniref:Uncharacterized protein n=1 Tax=Sphingomonas cavernae TaxID=2320861 RepID=A0A418WJQ1_9SPHN|nr:hypothetical protein D3876_08055 [Sphingomonas cavernae]
MSLGHRSEGSVATTTAGLRGTIWNPDLLPGDRRWIQRFCENTPAPLVSEKAANEGSLGGPGGTTMAIVRLNRAVIEAVR